MTEEEVLDGVLLLGGAYRGMEGRGMEESTKDEKMVCFERAKEGFVRLLGEHSAKAVNAAFRVASQIPSADERIAEYKRLWETAKVYLPEEAVTFNIANDLGSRLWEKGNYEEAKVFFLTALEGRRRVLGEEHSYTLGSMNNMGIILCKMEDYEGSLGYYQQLNYRAPAGGGTQGILYSTLNTMKSNLFFLNRRQLHEPGSSPARPRSSLEANVLSLLCPCSLDPRNLSPIDVLPLLPTFL